METTLKRKSIDDTNTTTTDTTDLKPTKPSSPPSATNKKQKTNTSSTSNTIPILRGRFKEKYLAKHSSLIKRSETASGIIITCGINAETRALGQAQRVLEAQLAHYPSYESTWTRFEGEFDVQDLDKIRQQGNNQEEDTANTTKENAATTTTTTTTNDKITTNNEDDTTTTTTTTATNEEDTTATQGESPSDKKKRTFQAVDAACSGLIFYRFRVNIKPTQFMDDMIQRFQQLQQKEEKEALATTIRHCARWVPMDYICHVTTERITDCFARRVLPECIADLPANTTIAIVSEIRNNLSITKPDLINIIAPQLPTHLKVDLKNPQYVIYVNIFKSVCGMAVLKDYYQRKKYNLGALLA